MAFYIARRLFWTRSWSARCSRSPCRLLPAPGRRPGPALRRQEPEPGRLDLIRHRLGLDQAWYIQFGKFVKTFFTGDQYGWPGLGYTFAGQASVLHLIMERAPRTLLLIRAPRSSG